MAATSQTNAQTAPQSALTKQPPSSAAAATPESAVNADSGNATAAAGQAQSATTNTQLLAGSASGGSGSLVVANAHSSNVTDTSSANAQSGLSVALAPTVLPGTPVPTGLTTASSGNTSATGLLAQNTVSNTSAGAVRVDGANRASVSAVSASTVDIKDTAASGSTSGAAWAVANGAAGSPSEVVAPDVLGASPTSGPVSAIGLTAQNTASSAVAAPVTVAGGQQNAHTIAVNNSQTVDIANGGAAVAVSAPATAAGAGAVVDARAASGSTSAVGLTAQNTVNTVANVSVHVGGQNFAPIQIIIDSVTKIFNLGVASATSGDATAGSGSGGAPSSATSGSAQATGAQVQTSVNIRSSAAVHVTGDNYNPINILLNLAANLTNWGVGLARSGDAGSGGGGGSASSGPADASGLQVLNRVLMWADASVDIDGNNFAPIYIRIAFNTNIDNRGVAGASSGNVAAGQTAPGGANVVGHAAVAASAGSGQTSGSGVVGSSVKAVGGDASAISNSVTANVISTQLSSANGSKPITSTTLAQMLHSLPSGKWDPFIAQNLPANPLPTVEPGLSTHSGNALSTGMQSQVDQINTQLAVCKDPQISCVAANVARLSITSQDGKNNPATRGEDGGPGAGGIQAQSGGALANATPTPTPTKPAAGGTRNPATSGGSTSRRAQARGATTSRSMFTTFDAAPTGHLVLVDLWDQWPGRRLPPMPNPLNRDPMSTTVTASLDGWPGADELPLPVLAVGGTGNQMRGASARRPSLDLATNELEEFPVMQIADVDPWAIGANLVALPMPSQLLPAVAGATSSMDNAAPAAPIAPAATDDGGAASLEVGLAAILAALGGLIGLRRRRLLLTLRMLPQVIGNLRV